MNSNLQCAADSVQVERLLLDEAGVAPLCQMTGRQLSEEGGWVGNLLCQQVAVTPHNVKQTHTGNNACGGREEQLMTVDVWWWYESS